MRDAEQRQTRRRDLFGIIAWRVGAPNFALAGYGAELVSPAVRFLHAEAPINVG
jgi:hypothetical protein